MRLKGVWISEGQLYYAMGKGFRGYVFTLGTVFHFLGFEVKMYKTMCIVCVSTYSGDPVLDIPLRCNFIAP